MAVRNFMMRLDINYPVAMADVDTQVNFGRVFRVPTSFLVDRQGNILERFDGYVERSVFENRLRSALQLSGAG